MTEDHREQAEAAERELADMERQSERVGEHIDQARDDCKAKQADGSVPGAAGDRGDEHEDGNGAVDGEMPSGSG
jgi:hypothetical protein